MAINNCIKCSENLLFLNLLNDKKNNGEYLNRIESERD